MASASVGRLVATLFLDDKQFQAALTGAERKVFSAGRSMSRVGATMTRSISLPLAIGAGLAAKFAADFEASMTKVHTLVGISAERVEVLSEAVLGLAGTTARGPRELADAMFFVTSASLRGKEAVEALEISAKLAAIGLGDTATVADAVTSAMNAYGSANLSAARAGNVLLAAVREGKIEADALAGSIGRVLGIAAAMGVEFEQVAAFIATFTRVGVDAEQAVTSFRAILTTFVKAPEGVRQALVDMGTDIDTVRRKLGEDFVGTLLELNRMLDGSKDRLGQLFPNVRAIAGFLGTAASQGKAFAAVLESINRSVAGNDLQKSFETTQKTSKFLFDQLLANSERFAIRLGRLILPALNDISTQLTAILDDTETISTSTLKWALGLGAVLAAVGPIIWSFGQVITLAIKLGTVLSFLVRWPLILATAIAGVGVTAGAMILGLEDNLLALIAKIPLFGNAFQKATSFTMEVFSKMFSFIAQGFAVMIGNWATRIFNFANSLRSAGFFGGMTERVDSLGRSLSDLSLEFGTVAAAAEDAAIAEEAYRAALAANAEVEAERAGRLGEIADRIGEAVAEYERLSAQIDKTSKRDLITADQISTIKTITAAFGNLTEQLLELEAAKGNTQAIEGLFRLDLEAELEKISVAGQAAKISPKIMAEVLKSYEEMAVGIGKRTRAIADAGKMEEVGAAFDQLTRQALELRGVLGDEALFEMDLTAALVDLAKLAEVAGLSSDQIDDVLASYDRLARDIEARSQQISVNIGETFARGFSGAIEGVLRGTRDFDFFDIMRDAGIASISDMFAQMLAKKLSFDLVIGDNFGSKIPNMIGAGGQLAATLWNAAMSTFSTGLGFLGGLFGLGGGATAAASSGGGIGTGAFATASHGLVTTGETLALLGDNPSGKELVLPFERSEEFAAKIAAAGAGSGGGTVVNVYSNQPTRVQRSGTRGGKEIIDVFIGQAEKKIAASILTGGIVDDAISTRFGLGGPGSLL